MAALQTQVKALTGKANASRRGRLNKKIRRLSSTSPGTSVSDAVFLDGTTPNTSPLGGGGGASAGDGVLVVRGGRPATARGGGGGGGRNGGNGRQRSAAGKGKLFSYSPTCVQVIHQFNIGTVSFGAW